MNYTQNEKIEQVTDSTMVVGVDIGSQIHYARAFDNRGRELTKRIFSFHNDLEGFNSFNLWAETLKTENKKIAVLIRDLVYSRDGIMKQHNISANRIQRWLAIHFPEYLGLYTRFDAISGLAVLFAVALIVTYGCGFNMLCSYNLQSTFAALSFYNPDTTPWIIGAVEAVLVGYCLLGGGKRVIKATSTLVPLMGVIYISVAFILTIMHINLVPGVVGRIFAEAFDFTAIFGGFAGSCMMFGIKRGLYSNEAGVGSAPNAAAAADVSHPVKQGLVQMLSVFIDTLLICTATAFMCLSSGIEPAKELAGAPYVQAALAASMGDYAKLFITVSMVLFAFTTLLGNLYYVDNAFAYVLKHVPGKTFTLCYRILACVLIFIGAGSSMGTMWDLADVTMGFMAIINLPVICILGGPALRALDDYTDQRDAGKNPEFKASKIGLTQKLDYWQD